MYPEIALDCGTGYSVFSFCSADTFCSVCLICTYQILRITTGNIPPKKIARSDFMQMHAEFRWITPPFSQ